MSGPGWFEAEITRRLGTLATAGVTQAANVAAAAALTSIDLVPALGTPDATGDLTALTGADAAQAGARNKQGELQEEAPIQGKAIDAIAVDHLSNR